MPYNSLDCAEEAYDFLCDLLIESQTTSVADHERAERLAWRLREAILALE
jgi:hypothetical protein